MRVLTTVDGHAHESPVIRVGQRLRGMDVVCELEGATAKHGMPKIICVDNGPELISSDLDCWAYWNKVRSDFSRPGKPADNAYTWSFNGKFRKECLNEHRLLSLEDAQEKMDAWRREHNIDRPHSLLRNIPPAKFAARCNSKA